MISRGRRRLHRRLTRRLVLPLVLSLAATLGFSACTPATPQVRIEVFGDSLAYQAAPYLNYFFAHSGRVNTKNRDLPRDGHLRLGAHHRPGGRPAQPAGLPPQRDRHDLLRRRAVSLHEGRARLSPQGQALIDKYESDARLAIMYAALAHIQIYFASTPISKADANNYVGDTPLGNMYASLAQAVSRAGAFHRLCAGRGMAGALHRHVALRGVRALLRTLAGRHPDGRRAIVATASISARCRRSSSTARRPCRAPCALPLPSPSRC